MKGFTLLELLVVITIFLFLGALSVPFYNSFQVSQELITVTDQSLRILRYAQETAIAGQNNSTWGIFFDETNKKFILFKGTNYASRDLDFDLDFDYKAIFAITTDLPGDEIVFEQYTGLPLDNTGTPLVSSLITLISSNNQTQTIDINSIGLVDATF